MSTVVLATLVTSYFRRMGERRAEARDRRARELEAAKQEIDTRLERVERGVRRVTDAVVYKHPDLFKSLQQHSDEGE